MKTTTHRQSSPTTKNLRHSSNYPQCLQPLPSTWVTVLETSLSSCYDEALLMCQYPDGYWAAWIPDVGEVKLHSGQFCRMS